MQYYILRAVEHVLWDPGNTQCDAKKIGLVRGQRWWKVLERGKGRSRMKIEGDRQSTEAVDVDKPRGRNAVSYLWITSVSRSIRHLRFYLPLDRDLPGDEQPRESNYDGDLKPFQSRE
jgi:hypothetical protein